MDISHKLRTVAVSLQDELAQADLQLNERRILSRSGFNEFLIGKKDVLKIKIYEEKSHQLPHLHIDYGRVVHCATYRINPATRLSGNLSRKYDRWVLGWIATNESVLLKIWHAVKSGQDPRELVVELDK